MPNPKKSARHITSAWLPFLPMQPIQVLTNNLLYDFLASADSDGQRWLGGYLQAASLAHG